MAKLIVDGGRRLAGEISIRGAKNAALPLFSAALLTDEEVVIHNCPRITDVFCMRSILERLGLSLIHI